MNRPQNSCGACGEVGSVLKDITLGQYFPGNSFLHKLDPRMKLGLVVLLIVNIFVAQTPMAYVAAALLIVLAVAVSGIPARLILKSLKPLIFIIVLTTVINIFYTPGEVLAQWWIFRITAEGIYRAAFMAIRIILLVVGTSLLTYTTSPIMLTDGLERVLSPLKKIKVPVYEFSLMMTIALRMIPTLVEEVDKITSAQKARGAQLETGNLFQRAKALVPILIPLFVSSFRRADELAIAMECRCYRGGAGRTRLKEYHLGGRDYLALAVTLINLGMIILANLYLPWLAL